MLWEKLVILVRRVIKEKLVTQVRLVTPVQGVFREILAQMDPLVILVSKG